MNNRIAFFIFIVWLPLFYYINFIIVLYWHIQNTKYRNIPFNLKKIYIIKDFLFRILKVPIDNVAVSNVILNGNTNYTLNEPQKNIAA